MRPGSPQSRAFVYRTFRRDARSASRGERQPRARHPGPPGATVCCGESRSNALKTRDQNIAKLKKLSSRLGIRPADVKVRPKEGSSAGVSLTLEYRGATIVRHCACEATRDHNFTHVVNWLGDLVRNLERRIETLEEAFHGDGVRRLPKEADVSDEVLRENEYQGAKTLPEALALIAETVRRLGLTDNDVKVTWSDAPNEAALRLRIGTGKIMEKRSHQQEDVRRNVAALALWLRCRALHVERGIETLDHVASSYLQLEAGRSR